MNTFYFNPKEKHQKSILTMKICLSNSNHDGILNKLFYLKKKYDGYYL